MKGQGREAEIGVENGSERGEGTHEGGLAKTRAWKKMWGSCSVGVEE